MVRDLKIMYPLIKKALVPVISLPTPKNISYFWGVGSFLGVLMVMQIITGLLASFYYVSGQLAWESIITLVREVNNGWLIRIFHSNGASFIFMLLFVHLIRGLFQASFYMKYVWISGWLIMFMSMAAAFLGYVLPWGQMSFWGATVIINLISVLPFGKQLVIWLWGGYYVSSYTCSFFYSLHFLIPLIIIIIIIVHLLALHLDGSSVSSGISMSSGLKMKFSMYFSYKDVVNLSLLLILILVSVCWPEWAGDSINFSISDLTTSPLHIQPEWYFLNMYAILRSIPNKVGGVAGFGLALMILLTLSFPCSIMKVSSHHLYKLMVWLFIFSNILLTWIGGQPVEAPFIMMGQILTFMYFSYFLSVFMLDWSFVNYS